MPPHAGEEKLKSKLLCLISKTSILIVLILSSTLYMYAL